MATEAVIRGIIEQNLVGKAGQAFRGAQTFPLQLQQARQQLAGGEQKQQIGDIWRRLQEAKLAGLPEELKATREQRKLTQQQTLATIGLRHAQTVAALMSRKQKATAMEKFQQGVGRLKQFGDNDLQGRFLIGSGLSDAGFKIGNLGQFSPSGVAPQNTEALNASMLQPHTSDQTTEEMLNEQHQLLPPSQKDLTQEDQENVNNLNESGDNSRNIINSILAQPEPKLDEFAKGQLTNLNKNLKDISASAIHAAEHEIPLYNRLNDLTDKLLPLPNRGYINWTTPAGQEFRALLARAQGDFIKTFHLGRMTQNEFNTLKKAVGGEDMYKSTLKNIFNRQLKTSRNDIKKADFYHDYVKGGGRSDEDASFKWLKSIGEEAAQPTEAKAAPKTTLSDEELTEIAQEKGVPLDVLKQNL